MLRVPHALTVMCVLWLQLTSLSRKELPWGRALEDMESVPELGTRGS